MSAFRTTLAAAVLTWLCVHSASAQGIVDHVKRGGALVLAHRESSIPFSYVDSDRKPIGYAIDLCLKIADAVRRKAGVKDVNVQYLMVSPADRIPAIERGKAHLECGSTTNNAERRQRVAFTIPHFITGARLLVKANEPIDGLNELSGRKLVSTRGTTPLKVIRQLNDERLLRLQIIEAPDHAKAVQMVETGEAQAFLMDDVLLYGLNATRPDPGALKVVGKFVTTEPLAIMLPKADVELKKIADDEMRRLIHGHEIHSIYDKWFKQPIPPSNLPLNLPVSYLLRDFWKYPSDWVPL